MSDSPKPLDQSRKKPASATPLQPRRRAILVGSSGGIGAALARKLANEGYTLALLDRNTGPLKTICAEINGNSGETRAIPYEHNVADYNSIPALLRKMTEGI